MPSVMPAMSSASSSWAASGAASASEATEISAKERRAERNLVMIAGGSRTVRRAFILARVGSFITSVGRDGKRFRASDRLQPLGGFDVSGRYLAIAAHPVANTHQKHIHDQTIAH
jgi:hypothetical protein